MDRPSLQEQLDSCRTPDDLLRDPNLRELADAVANDPQCASRLQTQFEFDSQLAQGLAAVSPPSDLTAKLTEAFRRGVELRKQDRLLLGPVADQFATEGSSEVSPIDPFASSSKANIFPKRRLVGKAVVATFALSAALAVLLMFFRLPPEQELAKTEPELANLALQFCTVEGEGWTSDFSKVPPKLKWTSRWLPLNDVSQPLRFRKIDPQLPGNWIVWQLNSNKGGRVFLLASDAAWKPNLISGRPSRTPIKNTGSWSVGVWTQNGVTYAVVVEGDSSRFEDVIQKQQTAEFEWRGKQTQSRSAA